MTSRTDRQPATRLVVRCLDLDTRDQPVVVLRKDSPVCRSEGFHAHARLCVENDRRTILATLFQTGSEQLGADQIGLSTAAWKLLQARDGESVRLSHPTPPASLSSVRAKVHGERLATDALGEIVRDVARDRYDDIQLAMLLTAIAARSLDDDELVSLTAAMVEAGERLHWAAPVRLDKHCVGGLPGNRTTPLVVAIVAANGLIMPKTSSRAITSPAGTADVMETLAPVALDPGRMRRVVDAEGGCVVWGGAIGLSPVDDRLIRVARGMDLDGEAQLVASVLSKKIAAGATHVVLDLPVGATAKLRNHEDAVRLGERLRSTAAHFDLSVELVFSDGRQPVGRGIGPALEARDVLAVLQNEPDAPPDLRDRAIALAGVLLELGGSAAAGDGADRARRTLESGEAWRKFQAICQAQGGLRTPPTAACIEAVRAPKAGRITRFDNRRLARLAKLAGAPDAPAAGVELHVKLDDRVDAGQPLFTLHAETGGELDYARDFADRNADIIALEAEP